MNASWQIEQMDETYSYDPPSRVDAFPALRYLPRKLKVMSF